MVHTLHIFLYLAFCTYKPDGCYCLNAMLCACFRPYLNAGKRELLADYALPVAVICMSLIGVFGFKDVDSKG